VANIATVEERSFSKATPRGIPAADVAGVLGVPDSAANRTHVEGVGLVCVSSHSVAAAAFGIGILPHFASFLLAATVVVPLYICSEAIQVKERVGIVCLAGAALTVLRSLYAILRALFLVLNEGARREPGPSTQELL
jgi:hypothetical protein